MKTKKMFTQVLGMTLFAIGTSAMAKEYIVRSPAHSFAHINPYVVSLSAQDVEAKLKQGFRIEPLIKMELFSQANGNDSVSRMTKRSSKSWVYKAIESVKANQLENGSGQGSLICLVDSGVSRGLGLDKKVLKHLDIITLGTADENLDSLGHGTNLAALMVGDNRIHRGVAPEARIISVKVIDATGGSNNLYVARGIEACIKEGVQVINLSLGSFLDSEIITEAIDRAKAYGISIFAAAGNNPTDIVFPARHSSVIAVGSIGTSHNILQFSGHGPELGFVAPGEDIELLRTETGHKGAGTSFSSAIASAIEAIRLSRTTTYLIADDLGKSPLAQGDGLLNAFRTAVGE